MEVIEKPVKVRLLERFKKARENIGPNWKRQLAGSDPFFNTHEGTMWMLQTAGAASDYGRISVDRIEKVTLALEKIAGITQTPTV